MDKMIQKSELLQAMTTVELAPTVVNQELAVQTYSKLPLSIAAPKNPVPSLKDANCVPFGMVTL